MTIAELERAIASYTRRKQEENKQKATYDYILANLIARGVQSAIVGGDGMPDITEVYSSLFKVENEKRKEERQALNNELSTLRFIEFANSYNKKFEEVQSLSE